MAIKQASWADFLALDERAQLVRVLEVMAEVVADAGESYNYKAHHTVCMYVHRGQPSCLIGRILYRLGVPLGTLMAMDDCLNGGLQHVAHMLGNVAEPVVSMMHHVQLQQDDGRLWGECLAWARLWADQHAYTWVGV